jgi:hypothetical protein
MHRYQCLLDNGQGGSRDLHAGSARAALARGIAWGKGGDWTYPLAFRVTVTNANDPEDRATAVVEMEQRRGKARITYQTFLA